MSAFPSLNKVPIRPHRNRYVIKGCKEQLQTQMPPKC